MNFYLFTDSDGNEWGTIAADDELEAMQLFEEDVTARPYAYLGEPKNIHVTEL